MDALLDFLAQVNGDLYLGVHVFEISPDLRARLEVCDHERQRVGDDNQFYCADCDEWLGR